MHGFLLACHLSGIALLVHQFDYYITFCLEFVFLTKKTVLEEFFMHRNVSKFSEGVVFNKH